MPTLNRSRRAREGAGLSVGQAARLIGVPIEQLHRVEENDVAYADADVSRFVEIYGVNVEWLSGRGELRDYEPLKSLRNADQLTCRDRAMLAELYASLPPRKR